MVTDESAYSTRSYVCGFGNVIGLGVNANTGEEHFHEKRGSLMPVCFIVLLAIIVVFLIFFNQ